MDVATIIIGGDVCPVGRNEEAFLRGDAGAIFGDLLPDFQAADLRIVNLESPFAEGLSPAEKSGPHLSTKPGCVSGLQALGIDVVGLANNHILDFGAAGLFKTIELCRTAEIDTVGAGVDLRDARKPLMRAVNGIRIGIMAFADHECSLATNSSAGANPMSAIEFVRLMRQHSGSWDRLIVLLHGGKEHYPYPSPVLQDTCRFLVEEGADAVICQHSHCIGAYETHRNGHIVYGQGNLIFDHPENRRSSWNSGYLVKLDVGLEQPTKMHLIPFSQSKSAAGVCRMAAEDEERMLANLRQMAAEIQSLTFVEDKWHEFCRREYPIYMSVLRGHSRILRGLNRATRFADHLYTRAATRALLNIIRCQAHREVLLTGLGARLSDSQDADAIRRRPPL